MNLSKSIALIFSLFLFQSLSAQTPLEKYEKESIYFKTGGFVKGGVKHNLLFSYRPLKKAMKSSPIALAELKESTRKRWLSTGLYVGGVAAVLGAITVNDPQIRNALLLGGMVAVVSSIPVAFTSVNKLNKSVWSYNRDLLLPEHQK